MKFNSLIPELVVSDLSKSRDFYEGLLGFKVEYERPENNFVFLSYAGSQLMIEQKDDLPSPWVTAELRYPLGRGVNFCIDCPDVVKIQEKLIKAGYPVRLPVEDKWYRCGEALVGERHILVMDPDGYLLRFAQDLEEKPIPGI